jgi:hypothetical protein
MRTGPYEPGVGEAWDAEIRRRVEELDSGAVETIPWKEVRERLFARPSDPPHPGLQDRTAILGSDNLKIEPQGTDHET